MATAATPSPTLIDMLRREIRVRHMSLRTEDTCVYRARDFVRFHGRRHPLEMAAAHVEAYLTMLANRRRVAASTHNQALSALLFLYRAVLKIELPWLDNLQRPGRPQRLPVILSVEEVAAVLSRMQGERGLLARLLYGTGMRINEALRLRVAGGRCRVSARPGAQVPARAAVPALGVPAGHAERRSARRPAAPYAPRTCASACCGVSYTCGETPRLFNALPSLARRKPEVV